VSTEAGHHHRPVNSSPGAGAPVAHSLRGPGRHRGLHPARVPLPPSGAPAEPPTFEDPERFAAYVAHELRTPITLQRALVEVALTDPHADTAALRAMGEGVLASCDEQQRLIEALLDLTRSQCGLTRHEAVDIAAITNQALRAHNLSEFESFVAFERARTTGDPDLVERLAANLVSNATRHNVTGGRIELATRTEGEHAVLSVANTGRLIPTGELARLFQPFQRLGSQPQACADGIGLGLAIVQAIADAHDAIVTAHARAGGGLKIDVSFPATVNTAGAPSGEQLRTTTSPLFGVSAKVTAEAFSTHAIVSA
jgi:signal transduction histidine kinase